MIYELTGQVRRVYIDSVVLNIRARSLDEAVKKATTYIEGEPKKDMPYYYVDNRQDVESKVLSIGSPKPLPEKGKKIATA